MASGDTILYLTKRAVVVSGRFFFFCHKKSEKKENISKNAVFCGQKANKRNRSTGIQVVNSVTVLVISAYACLILAASFPVAFWST